ncbi:MAG TPA: hypothetical protein VGH59_14680 [Casimicrobiaceae bacterium]
MLDQIHAALDGRNDHPGVTVRPRFLRRFGHQHFAAAHQRAENVVEVVSYPRCNSRAIVCASGIARALLNLRAPDRGAHCSKRDH